MRTKKHTYNPYTHTDADIPTFICLLQILPLADEADGGVAYYGDNFRRLNRLQNDLVNYARKITIFQRNLNTGNVLDVPLLQKSQPISKIPFLPSRTVQTKLKRVALGWVKT